MGTHSVTLQRGLLLDGEPQLDCELREPSAGDIIEASQAAERVVPTSEGPELVASPTLVGSLVLCRQIVRVGAIQGPLTIEQLKLMSAEDLNRLHQATADLEAASLKVTQQRGRNDDTASTAGAGDSDLEQSNGHQPH